MNLLQFWGSVELGLVYGLVAMGVLLSFRILDFPDLTADGSFPLGAAVCATLIVSGWNPWLATMAALVSGMLAGLFTAWLNVRWHILNLLASILTMTALYSLNLRIMGRPNIALIDENTIFSFLENQGISPMTSTLILLAILAGSGLLFLYRFLISEVGLAIRATGINSRMARAQGIKTTTKVLMGMGMSNAFIALAGALFAQSQGFADVTMGVGTIVVGLAAVIIGEALFHTRSLILTLLSCLVGAILYRFAVALALNSGALGLRASDLQLVTAVIVGFAMVLPRARHRLMHIMSRRTS